MTLPSPSSARAAARLPEDEAPRLVVLVDVEEEFDWERGFHRSERGVTHLSEWHAVQSVFDAHGIVPVAVCTHPVVEDEAGAAALRELVEDGRILPGAHLHPWVTPPYDDADGPRSSYPCNLPAEVEGAKLAALTERVEQALGVRPKVYQAGRYGIGPHTAGHLAAHGYQVDMSVCPPFDYTADGGPDFSHASNDPQWFGDDDALLELPITGDLVGLLGRGGLPLYRFARRPGLAWARLGGLLARTGLLERLRLSPEGQTCDDMLRLVRHLLERGTRVFTFSFHSPTLKPGCTSYVRTAADRDAFLRRCDEFFSRFLGELGGLASTPLALRDELLTRCPPPRLDPTRSP